MIERRAFLISVVGSALPMGSVRAQGEGGDLAKLLSALENSPDDVLAAKRFSELEGLSFSPSPETLKQRPDLPKTFRRPSRRAISDRTRQLLVAAEVSSPSRYEAKFKSPIWPKGKSGVTIGVGYDMGYVTASQFRTDWTGYIDAARIDALEAACGVKGPSCQGMADGLGAVRIEWDEARKQFDYFVKLFMNLVEATFPNCNQLSDDSFGALTSIVYNRGNAMRSAMNDPIDRRREMREIRALMQAEDFTAIPDRIRSMKRVWRNDPDSRGLLLRRDAEAQLFQSGLGRA